MKRTLVNEISLPHDWTRNRGLEARLARPLCLEYQSLAAFVDITSPHCTEGRYESPSDAIALVKGYRPHAKFEGFECCIQRPIFRITTANRVIKGVSTDLEERLRSNE